MKKLILALLLCLALPCSALAASSSVPTLNLAGLTDMLAKNKGKVIITAPQGKTFNEQMAQEWSKEENLTFICGHFEGFDQRVYDLADEMVSIGDYVLTGGELPTMSMIDATVRLLPGILGNALSTVEESFSDGLLEYPQYTRPANFRGMEVPEILLNGHHAKIQAWRQEQARLKTVLNRPDLLKESTGEGEEIEAPDDAWL